jgi:hypothetical protein
LVRRNVRWWLLLLLDAYDYLFQRPVVRDSIHSENMLYAYAYTHSYSDATSANSDSDFASANADS